MTTNEIHTIRVTQAEAEALKAMRWFVPLYEYGHIAERQRQPGEVGLMTAAPIEVIDGMALRLLDGPIVARFILED